MTRQVERQNARVAAKSDAKDAYNMARKEAKRALLERQTAREKAGAYSGRGVAASIASSRSRINSREVKKGKPFGRIIRIISEFGREFSFHATKGWRSHRA